MWSAEIKDIINYHFLNLPDALVDLPLVKYDIAPVFPYTLPSYCPKSEGER